MSYPPGLQWAVRESKLLDDPEFKRQIREYRCSPIRLLDYCNRSASAHDALRLYDASEGYTKTVNLGNCGFVKG
jgi:hypothetical protein